MGSPSSLPPPIPPDDEIVEATLVNPAGVVIDPTWRRPVAMTVVGVLSIILGGIGLLVGTISLVTGLVIHHQSNQPTAQQVTVWSSSTWNVPQPVATATVPRPGLWRTEGLSGLSPDAVETTWDVLNRRRGMQRISEPSVRRLLEIVGAEIIPIADPSEADVGGLLSRVDESTNPETEERVLRYRFAGGTLEVKANEAVWRNNNGAGPVGVVDGMLISRPGATGTATAGAPSTGPSVTPEQAEAVADEVDRQLRETGRDAMTFKQRTIFEQSILQMDPTPATSPDEVRKVGGSPAGALTITTEAGTFTFIGTWAEFEASDFTDGLRSTQTAYDNGLWAGATGMGAFAAVMASGAAMLGVALFFVLAGIFAFRTTPKGRTFQRLAAGLSLIVLSGWAVAWFVFLGQAAGDTGETGGWIAFIAIVALLAAAYPVAVLILLRTRRVRAWYDGMA